MRVPVSADSTRLSADTTAVTADATGRTIPTRPPGRFFTADRLTPTADRTDVTVDADVVGAIPEGWPCAPLGATPPSVVDAQAAPTADQILPQIAGVLTPRGPAWGTDEAGDGRGASPVMRQVWRALAAWVARLNADEFTLATQALPSAITTSLPDWEAEYGLPDPCTGPFGDIAARIRAVRTRFAARGGSSPGYFECLAAAIGCTVWIEEPTQFFVDISQVTQDSIEETWFRIDEGEIGRTPLEGFILHPDPGGTDMLGLDPIVEQFFTIDGGEIDATPLEDHALNTDGSVWKYWIVHVTGLAPGMADGAALECLIRGSAPAHTIPLFRYAL